MAGVIMRIARSADLGALVAERRAQQGLSQEQLAKNAGVTRDWLVRFERGKPSVTLHRVFWVLDALGLALEVRDDE